MRESFYVVELYSGNGSVSRILSRVLGVKAIRLDMDPEAGADISIDLTKWNATTAAEVKRLAGVSAANRKRAVIWASPPCTEYSNLKTSGPRNLLAADACVAVVARIAADLDAAVVLIENPATGLLRERAVIAPYPHSCELDYCQYGYAYRKRTMIWSTRALPASFEPKLCPGLADPDDRRNCPCMYTNLETGKAAHVIDMCQDVSLAQRISVPDQLACLVGRALVELLPPLAHERAAPVTPTQRQREKEHWEVDFVEQGVMEDGELWLKVHWVGYDLPSWVTADELDASPAEYDFLTPETRQWVAVRYEALHQQQRKRQLTEQQQGRITRTRSAANSSRNSSSSSRGSRNPLLKDGVSD